MIQSCTAERQPAVRVPERLEDEMKRLLVDHLITTGQAQLSEGLAEDGPDGNEPLVVLLRPPAQLTFPSRLVQRLLDATTYIRWNVAGAFGITLDDLRDGKHTEHAHRSGQAAIVGQSQKEVTEELVGILQRPDAREDMAHM